MNSVRFYYLAIFLLAIVAIVTSPTFAFAKGVPYVDYWDFESESYPFKTKFTSAIKNAGTSGMFGEVLWKVEECGALNRGIKAVMQMPCKVGVTTVDDAVKVFHKAVLKGADEQEKKLIKILMKPELLYSEYHHKYFTADHVWIGLRGAFRVFVD